ncbi:MAG: phosphoribosylglycinamide formyltransferase [Gemmatimonadaceae bacterium]
MHRPRARLAVLASGSGTNLQAIHDDLVARGAAAPAELALVVSDRERAGALERARGWGVTAIWLPRSNAAGLGALLAEHRITLVALAGYLRLIPPDVVRAYHGRLLNIHPALLPAFGGPGMYGARVHEAVLRAGSAVSGATVHFVSERYDEGAIIAQARVPVHAADTPATLAERVLGAEHRLYPACVAAVAAGTVTLGRNGQVHGASTLDFDRVPSRTPFPH